MELKNILIVEESRSAREYLTELLQILGFHVHAVIHKTHFLTDLHQHNPDVLLLGSCTNPGQLKAFAKVVRRENNSVPIIYIGDDTPECESETVPVAETVCHLPKSFTPDELKCAIDTMIKKGRESGVSVLEETIVGKSSQINQIKQHISRLSQAEATVLITGESGTGKELVARAIHELSPRAKKPFVKVNSAALPDNLIESELFGFEKGAFTGAWKRKPGKFVLAHSGTLLLDEIGEIPLHLQAKLLQVLEDSELSALGGTTSAKIDVRVLAATNSDLKQKVSEELFRSDLYYRLNVVTVHIPPLRERMEDIGLLCQHFLEKHAALNGKETMAINSRTQEQMYRYSWPGNIRELENFIKGIAVLGDEGNLGEKMLHAKLGSPQGKDTSTRPSTRTYHLLPPADGRSLKQVAKEAARRAESTAILEVLSYTRWNRRKASELLEISYKALLNKIKEYRIEEQYRKTINRNMESDGHQERY